MTLPSQVQIYDRAKSVVFLKTKDNKLGGLSNMAAGFPLEVNGVPIRTSEALYQACRFPRVPELQRRIIGERSPMTAKMRGKPFRNDSRPDWKDVRVKIMRWCLRVKLAQNQEEFEELLLKTNNRQIVEQSRRDNFWGAKITDSGRLCGMNVLGQLLMELREQLKGDATEHLRSVPSLSIPDFLLLDEPIRTVADCERNSRPVVAMPQLELPIEAPAPLESVHMPLPGGDSSPKLL